MKYLVWAVVFVLIIGAIYFLGFRDNDYPIVNYPPKVGPIVAFGDSLVAGVGAETPGGFVTMLSERLDEPIINLGRGGDTTEAGLGRISEVLELKPSVVLVLLGGNDYLSRIPKETQFQNLKTIIETLQSSGALVVLLGVRGGLLYDSYEADYKNLAEETGAVYIPNVLGDVLGEAQYMDDAIHPNEEGYRIIADEIFPVLEKLR